MNPFFIIWLAVSGLLLAGSIGYIISLYNSLIQVKNNIYKAWKNIDVLLLQRYEEIPKLVDISSAYMKYEKDLLVSLTELRAGYFKAVTPDLKTGIENRMSGRMAQLKAIWEKYPDLKADKHFLQVQGRLSALETVPISDLCKDAGIQASPVAGDPGRKNDKCI